MNQVDESKGETVRVDERVILIEDNIRLYDPDNMDLVKGMLVHLDIVDHKESDGVVTWVEQVPIVEKDDLMESQVAPNRKDDMPSTEYAMKLVDTMYVAQ
jgi:hypothetical protein